MKFNLSFSYAYEINKGYKIKKLKSLINIDFIYSIDT